MSKIYKGYELLKAIENGEIKENTEFLTKNKTKIYYDGSILRYKEAYCGIKANTEIGMSWLKGEFELIKDNKVDIDSIEELLKIEPYEADKTDIVINRNKINELLKWAKQADKEIKSIKEEN